MEKRIEFNFEYDKEGDVLSIFDYNKPLNETIEFNEYINVDLGKSGEIVGLEIFDASKFFKVLNETINQEFLTNLKKIELVQADYRNNIFIAVILHSFEKEIYQQLPPLQKSNYTSPLILSA